VSVDDILGLAFAGGGPSTIVPKIEPASWHYMGCLELSILYHMCALWMCLCCDLFLLGYDLHYCLVYWQHIR
jgi:hypothetical protein